jgi:hypothetical protein
MRSTGVRRGPSAPTSLTLCQKGVKEIPRIRANTHLLRLDLSDNPLTDFREMIVYYRLNHFVANRTNIQSFRGTVRQNETTDLTMITSPLGSELLFPLMALIVFGGTLTAINSDLVSAEQRRHPSASGGSFLSI